MRKVRTALLSAAALVVVGGIVPIANTAFAADTNLGAALDQVLSGADGSVVAVQVREAETGTVLYARNPDQRVIPASNNKLLTSTAALDVLGVDYRFQTTVLASGTRNGSILAGSLYLKGGGDPTILAADYDALAAEVAATGITAVTGELVADDSWFDSDRLGTEWAADDESTFFTAPTSALTLAASDQYYDPGAVAVNATGTTTGQPATLSMSPTNGTEHLVNWTTTGAVGSASSIAVNREHGTENLVVTGSIAPGASSGPLRVSVWNPAAYAASVFHAALSAHGVQITGATSFRTTPSTATQIAAHQSMTLAQLYTPFLKLSNNMHAEVLMKAMGRQKSNSGTWSAGIAAAKTALSGMGVTTSGLRTVDGSGLSRQDLVTTQQVTNLLLAARGKPWFNTWYNALPIAGIADPLVGGTLRSRMAGTAAANNLHGKTGTLTGVGALSGYVTDASGRALVFSAIINNNMGSMNGVLDQVAVTLANATPDGLSAKAMTKRAPAQSKPQRDDVECTWIDVNRC